MTEAFIPQILVVDFNHHRGPEIELWADDAGQQLFQTNDWTQLAFLALPDGAHASNEEFSYFTLVSQTTTDTPETSLFGISCTRQIRADKLKVKSAEVTRSFVQKAVVVIVDRPGILGQLRERLAAVTAAWFAQEDFSDIHILKEFQASLQHEAEAKKHEKDAYFGLSLRELLHELRHLTLILVKCLLLQKRVLFFGTRCERLCMTQFALVSLIPHLLDNLQDCASPKLNTYVKTVSRATNLRTSERSSLLAYMGLPLQVFGEHSFFSPYTPLQQLDFLSSPSAKSYLAGSTNVLFLSQRDLVNSGDPQQMKNRYCDILVNLDEVSLSSKITILDPALRSALSLSAADRRWIDHLTQTVLDTWNPADPSRPTTHGYQGSEDAIRLSFEEYILSFVSSVAYKNHFDNHPNPYLSKQAGGVSDERYPDPLETAGDFNHDFLALWKQTPNYTLWHSLTDDSQIFDIVEPRHPTAGGLNIEDVQRRVGAAVSELHIDDRTRQARETAGKAIEVGRERVGAGVARFWKEVENFKERREGSRSRQENDKKLSTKEASSLSDDSGVLVEHPDVFDAGRRSTEHTTANAAGASSVASAAPQETTNGGGWTAALRSRAANVQRPNVDTVQMQAAARENAARAGAYLNSWGSWAKDKSREWQESRAAATFPQVQTQVNKEVKESSVVNDSKVETPASLGAVAAAKNAMGSK
ncbi:hypothetical protein LTR64_000918 [Lithohypha guttulata]|uniref:uncharacterized protein n=1 Tax=Lithohypha guttulata TaxID=1690604 RepID=UPI002DE08D62|nr:hypothetical protein LTR51_003112 [Lithohypha guttulata]